MQVNRLSVRVVMIATAVVAVCLHFTTRQWQIAAELRSSKATIFYRYQFENWDDLKGYSRNNELEMHPFTRLVGPDIGSTIVEVGLSGPENPTRMAELCSKLPNLRLLAIQDCPFSDEDLKLLTGLNDLRGLYLRGTSITDASIQSFRKFQNLHVLNITGTSLSQEALFELRKSLPKTKIHSGKSFSGGMM